MYLILTWYVQKNIYMNTMFWGTAQVFQQQKTVSLHFPESLSQMYIQYLCKVQDIFTVVQQILECEIQ